MYVLSSLIKKKTVAFYPFFFRFTRDNRRKKLIYHFKIYYNTLHCPRCLRLICYKSVICDLIREEMENDVVTFHTFTSDKIGLRSKKIREVIFGQKDKDYPTMRSTCNVTLITVH